MSDFPTIQSKQATLDFTPHENQEEVADACLKYRYVTVRAGRRWGKSALALNIVLREALNDPGRYWIIAPEYKQAKSIYWRDLIDKYIPRELIVKRNDNELMLTIQTESEESIIEFKGSDNESSLRGAGLKGVVLDEFAFQKPGVWERVVQPMLLQTQGWGLFITTPNGVANHFKKFWDDAVALEAEKNPYWKTFHYTSYDNPLISPDEIENMKKTLTSEYFEQEYMAGFSKFTGLIYKEFDSNIHVQDFEVDEDWTFFRAVDFGATSPNAVLFLGMDRDGTIYIFDEIYMSDIYTSELAELIKQKSAHRYFVSTYADSANKQSILDLNTYGIFCTPVAKNSGEGRQNWVVAGIERVRQLLKENKIVVHPRCKSVITEFMSYSWRKDASDEPVDFPEQKNDHLMDALRYFVVSHKASQDEGDIKNYLENAGGISDPVTGY